jgi:hypothetical protein
MSATMALTDSFCVYSQALAISSVNSMPILARTLEMVVSLGVPAALFKTALLLALLQWSVIMSLTIRPTSVRQLQTADSKGAPLATTISAAVVLLHKA